MSLCLFFLIVCAITAKVYGSDAVPKSEYDSLSQLYNSTQGSNWNYPASVCNHWKFPNRHEYSCSDNWCGLSCSVVDGQSHISAIQLPGYNLNSTSPLPRLNFPYLEIIDLTSNILEGPIPDSVFNSQVLTQVRFPYTRLNATIPSSFGNAAAIVNFDINTNYFTGRIPRSIKKLKKIQNLYLYGNSLSGSIPDEIGELDEVQFIWLQSNSLSGSIPDSIGNLTKVANINLSKNNLDGKLPASIYTAGAGYLHDLDLSHNNITGSLPSGISALRVTTLNLSYNKFSGRIPSEVASLPNVKYLYLNNNHFSTDIPRDVLNLCDKLNAEGGFCDLSNQTPRNE